MTFSRGATTKKKALGGKGGPGKGANVPQSPSLSSFNITREESGKRGSQIEHPPERREAHQIGSSRKKSQARCFGHLTDTITGLKMNKLDCENNRENGRSRVWAFPA